MPMRTRDHLQTMAYAYQEICQGEEPWVALGNFMNHWFDYSKDRRALLIQEAPTISRSTTLKQKRWAAFIAASVEFLCQKYAIPCPAWVFDPTYTLGKPWFDYPNAHRPETRQKLIERTPEPFTRRNIYCGNRIYDNKYELGELVAKMKDIHEKQAKQAFSLEQIAEV